MKPLFIAALTFLIKFSFAQKNITFYDHQWNKCEAAKARFYSTIDKTDSGWLRMDYYVSTKKPQMIALYKDSTCDILNGNAYYYYANGNVEAEGRKLNNKEEGIYLRWHSNGMMADSGNFINGNFIGTKLSWHFNGNLSDSLTRINDSTVVSVSWFDNGNPDCYGYYINGKKTGKWNYFHSNGKQAAIELNAYGKVTNAEFFNEDGSIENDTSLVNREAVFKNGYKDWVNYLSGKIYWPEEYKITNANKVTVVVSFVLDEEGKIATQYIDVPFHYLIDNIALDAIKKSPTWMPALNHNRRVKAYRRQPLTFMQE